MASADYSVGTKVTADVSNFEKGMNKAEKSLKGFSEKLANSIDRLGKKGLIGSIANVTLAMQGLTQSFSKVIQFAKDVGNAINECTEAYKGQIIAERALDTAIQNNPFISGESSKALKQFASEMQKVSNYGDEQLIPMMTNLVSLGRTESEVMQIVSVAMDMSAGMGISLDTAIIQLNATLNGNIGRLGQQSAELKGLTEEELKQGRAIEILGEKFKGLSGATADTSKQLQNIKGDFKEALGEFTLPSSDMWNKFWAGFYQKGIEAINKINAFMDSQIIGKKLANAITDQIARINPGDIGGRVDYTRNVLRVIGDSELEALKNYLSGLRTLSAEQEIILKRIKAEEDSRYQTSINAKKEAEDKKKQAEVEAQITAELQKQEEISKKKTDWSSKLLSQRIEMLETERDMTIENAENMGEETYTIWRDYNEKILTLKLEQLSKERETALSEENLTGEEINNINEYYANEERKVYTDLGKFKKKLNDKEVKDEEKKGQKMLAVMKNLASGIANVLSKTANIVGKVFSTIGKVVKNIFSGIKNIFSKMFEFNVDDALDGLLVVEDKILTFFVETLPQLPAFFESAMSSVLVLVQTLINSINWEDVTNYIKSIVESIDTYAPQIIQGIGSIFVSILEMLPKVLPDVMKTLGDILTSIGQFFIDNQESITTSLSESIASIIQGLADWISSGGWKTLLDGLLAIQKAIETVVTDNLETLVDTIVSALPDLIQTLIDSIVSASQTFAKLIKPIVKLIIELLNAIIEVAFSDEVIDASLDAIMALIEAIFDDLIPAILKLIPKLIVKIGAGIIKNFPKLVVNLVKGLIKAFLTTNWASVTEQIFMGFIDAFKELFGIHSPSTLFEEFGGFMIEGLVNGLKGIAEAVNIILQPIIDLISDVVTKLIDGFVALNEVSFKGLTDSITAVSDGVTKLSEVSFEGISDNIKTVNDGLSGITQITFDGLNKGITAVADGVSKITDSVTALVKELGNLIDKAGKAVEALNPLSSGSSSDSSSSTGEKVVDTIGNILTGGLWGIGKGLFGFATGSQSVPKGLALVGEAGPELVNFRGGEQVINANNTQKALQSAGGKTINQNITFNNLQDTSAYAMIQQLKQYNRQMAINGII